MKTGEILRFQNTFIEHIIPSSKPVEASFLIASGCPYINRCYKAVGYMDEGLFID
jgi:hypothetical protein